MQPDDRLQMTAVVASPDGRRLFRAAGNGLDPVELGVRVAGQLQFFSAWPCPVCHHGRMLVVELLPPARRRPAITKPSALGGTPAVQRFSATIGKMPTNARFRVAVIGGGISGLAAAYRPAKARAAGQPVEEHLVEAQARLGGVIHTEQADGCLIEAGPDSFLSEKPQAFDLARELGLAGDVVGSDDARRRTYILHGRKLATLPDGLMLLVPTRLLPMLSTPRVPLDRALLRCFLGGSRDEAILNLDDEQATRLLLEELRQILGLDEAPLFVRIYRWRRSMAQYAVGHLDRVAAIHQRLRHHPGMFLAGNWESGIGISDCIRSGQTAAANCLRYLAEVRNAECGARNAE